jgi:hypothetical protein
MISNKGKIMKVVIRRSAFETNSSSNHSITISREYALWIDCSGFSPDKPYEITGDNFGWEVDQHNSLNTKLQYCIATIASLYRPDTPEALMATDAFIDLQDVFSKRTGTTLVVIADNNLHYPFGYVDHQSLGIVHFSDKEWLTAFLFNCGSDLYTDHDNH